jgi:phosphatidylserine/phosphatidylglycerophosphate/cardiolipin synthase-like enzyme
MIQTAIRFFLLAMFIFSSTALGMEVEVVQSIPVETTLKVEGIRETQAVWVEMIAAAKQSIDIEQFYIHHQTHQSLEPVLNAIQASAARGVQIRLIVDSKFLQNYPEVPRQLAALKNIQVRVVNYSKFGGVQHAKFFVIDREHAFVGSANFDWLALSHIHEVGVRVKDPSVAQNLISVFEQDWNIANPSESRSFLPLVATPGLQTIGSPNQNLPTGVSPTLNAIVSAIGSASQSLKIQVYQYSTKGGFTVLDQEIRKAAARGVQVRLLVDAVSLRNSSAELKALSGVKNVQVKAVTIPQWSGGEIPYSRLVHSKYFTLDGKLAWIGTENWSEGYFNGCRNVGVLVQNTNVSTQLEQIHDRLWGSAYAKSL